MELAEEIERQLRNDASLDPSIMLGEEKWCAIIAALRRADLAQTEIKGHMRVEEELKADLRKMAMAYSAANDYINALTGTASIPPESLEKIKATYWKAVREVK